jgi:hypothetical protein
MRKVAKRSNSVMARLVSGSRGCQEHYREITYWDAALHKSPKSHRRSRWMLHIPPYKFMVLIATNPTDVVGGLFLHCLISTRRSQLTLAFPDDNAGFAGKV